MELIQNVLLSDVMIVLFMGVMILVVSWWSLSLREFAGYTLGWLVGVFVIIMVSTLMPNQTVDPSLANAPPVQLTFLNLIIPSVFGLLMGFFLITFVRAGSASSSRIRRALTIAFLVSFLLCMAYFLLMSDRPSRIGIAMFILTFGIGFLLSSILSRGMMVVATTATPVVVQQTTEAQIVDPMDPLAPAAPVPQQPSPAQQLRLFRERLRQR